MRASFYWLCLCAAAPWLSHAARRVAAEPTQFPGHANSPVLFTIVWIEVTWSPLSFKLGRGFTTLSRQTLLSEDRQCCESWRDAEHGVRAVCAVRDRLETCGESGSESPSDMTGEDLVLVHWVVLLFFVTTWHCRQLSDERYADHIQLKYWLLRLTPDISDRSPPVLRRQQSVSFRVTPTDRIQVTKSYGEVVSCAEVDLNFAHGFTFQMQFNPRCNQLLTVHVWVLCLVCLYA